MYSFWSFFLKKRQFGVLLIVALAIFGIVSLNELPKESAPSVEVPIAVVSTALPGSSAEDVEKLVTNSLERSLKNNLDNVKNITSSSQSGFSTITVEFEASADLRKSIQKLRDEVDFARADLPEEANDPRVIEIDFGAEPVLTATIGSDVPLSLLYALADEVTDELEAVKGVSTVSVSGNRDAEVQVLVRREALHTYGLTMNDIARAISVQNISLPAGAIRINAIDYPVRFSGDITSPEEIRDIAITSIAGTPVYVRDVADVIVGFEKATTLSRTSINGQPSEQSFTFNVFKASGANITDVSAAAIERLEELQADGELLDNSQVLIMFDRGELLQDDLLTLGKSGIGTILLVLAVLFIAIGAREALIASSVIPLAFLFAFVAMRYSGNTLNFVSLFSLILAIGIIVDSAIVMVEGINTRLKTKSNGEQIDKNEAARNTIKEFHWPLTSGSATTIAVFAPLFLVSGITGEFIASIPFTIISVLLSSLFVTLALVPLVAVIFLRRRKTTGALAEKRRQLVARASKKYKAWLKQFLQEKATTKILIAILGVFFLASFALPITGAVSVVFFSDDDADYTIVEVELPYGSILSATDIEVRKAEEVLYTIPEIASFVTTVGRSSEFSSDGSGASVSERFGNMFITLRDDRTRSSVEIMDSVRTKMSAIHTAEIRADQLSDGPPSGDPILITFFGENLDDLDIAADTAADILATIPGTVDIVSSTKNNGTEFVLTVDRAKAISEGVTTLSVAQNLRGALYGSTATVIKQKDTDIDVVTKLVFSDSIRDPHATNQTTIESLQLIPITGTTQGVGRERVETLIGSFTESSIAPNRASISHKDASRISVVSSKLSEGVNARRTIATFKEKLAAANALPDGVSMRVGGENEDVDQSFKDMGTSLIIGLVAMFAILILQFNSFRYASYILMTVPLSLIGVFAGLLIVDRPLSFPSIMGFIALAGIVVNNAIILIDTINNRREEDLYAPLDEIVVEASASRLRPVLLTAITTIVGIFPLVFAAALWAPLAYSIMFGLTFATILTLVLIPAVYYHWPSKRHKTKVREEKPAPYEPTQLISSNIEI